MESHPLADTITWWLQLRPDDRPPHVVSVLMQELSTNEETDWVEQLVAEMVDGVTHLRHSPDALHIMKESLALPCLRDVFFEEQLGVSPDLLQALCQQSRSGSNSKRVVKDTLCHA